jgi:hypothetical protein
MAYIDVVSTGPTDGNGFYAVMTAAGTISDTNGTGSLAVRVTLYSTNNNFSNWTINCVAQETNATPNTIIINNSVQRTLAKNSSLLVGQGTWTSPAYTGSKSIRLVATVDAPSDASYVPNNTTVEMTITLPTVSTPFSFTPFGFTPFGFTPFGFTPFGFTPFGFTPFSFAPFGFTPTPLPPDPPTNLSVTNITRTSARLNWNAVSGASSYDVYLNGVLHASAVSASATFYDLTGLSQNTSYTFGVRVTTSTGTSAVAQISGTTLSGPGARYNGSAWTDTTVFKRYDAATSQWVSISSFKRYDSSTSQWKDITS